MRITVLGLVLLLALGANGGGCNNGVVGVQDYGAVTGRVLDATTNRPIGQAYVSVGSLYVVNSDNAGAFTVPHVPVGDQDVTARAPGFTTADTTVTILKGQTASAGYIRLTPVAMPANRATLPPPATPTPSPEPTSSSTPPPSETSQAPSTSPTATPSTAASASP